MRTHRFLIAAASLAMVALSASAAPVSGDTPHNRALAAGYKAAFLCSDLFNAGMTEAQATADDLEGIYPEYQALVRTLPAKIDTQARTVSVAFDDSLPPRIAAWRPNLGCAQLPIGADPKTVSLLSRLDNGPDAPPLPVPPLTQADPKLRAVIAKAFDKASYGAGTETTAVVVITGDQIIGEQYRTPFDPTRPQRTWSAAKSLTATVIGRAVQMHLLDVSAPVPVPEWQAPGDPRAAITLADLMHMQSGLWSDGPGNRTDDIYLGGATVTQKAVAMPLEAVPGTRFNYANDDPLLAVRGLRAVLKDDQNYLRFPFTQLLWKIGMRRTFLETDWQGNFILSSQVWSTARDLGRLGQLYLHDGVWNGEQLLPPGWSRFVATPSGAQPPGEGRPGYGAFFWLYGPAQGLPTGTYAMDGNRGQYVFIVPSRGMVIVRRGFDAAGKPPFDVAGFVRDVLASVGGR